MQPLPHVDQLKILLHIANKLHINLHLGTKLHFGITKHLREYQSYLSQLFTKWGWIVAQNVSNEQYNLFCRVKMTLK